jgi:hypothetical protein
MRPGSLEWEETCGYRGVGVLQRGDQIENRLLGALLKLGHLGLRACWKASRYSGGLCTSCRLFWGSCGGILSEGKCKQ